MKTIIERRRQPYLCPPVQPLTPFSFSDVVDEVRATHFPGLERRVEVRISSFEALASCHYNFMAPREHMVRFHPILNHPETPLPVVRFLAKHELTHALMPEVGHGEAFWDHEFAIAPERGCAWRWIQENYAKVAKTTDNGYVIFRTWRRHFGKPRTAYQHELPLDPERYANLCPGDGQLMLPPDWSPQPLPASRR